MVRSEQLVSANGSRIAFDKAAIMRRAYQLGRFALQLCRARREPAAERNRMLSRFLTKAWAEAKAEARELARRIERDAETHAFLAERAKANAALAATFGNDRTAIETAIAGEHMRDRMNFAAVDRLHAALNHLGA